MFVGHIRKRGKKYAAIVELERDSTTGKRKQSQIGLYKTKKEAEGALSKTITDLNCNDYISPEKSLLKDFLTMWVETYAINLSPTTYNGYKQIINNHIIPKLGNRELQKLQPLHIQKYYNELSKTLKGKTLLQHHRVLRKALDYAWKMQVISKNPADLLDSPKVKKYKATVLEVNDVKKLLNIIQNTQFEIPVNLAIGLGLRLGEILGLRWKDIDFDNGIIKVEQTLVRAGNELIFKEPKTEESSRSLSVPDTLLKLLKDHKRNQLEMKMRLGVEYDNKYNLVNTKYNGSIINTATFSHAFGDFIRKHKQDLPQIRFHDLRHTNATLMLLSGTPAKVASSRLGHSTINITMDLYSHVLKDMNIDAAKKLNSVIYN